MSSNRLQPDHDEPASGFDALIWALNIRLDLTMSQRLVLIYLAKHANGDGTNARPSVTTMMALTGLSRRGVQYALRDLSGMGIIRQTAPFIRPTMDRKGRPAIYALSMRLVITADLDPAKVDLAKEQEAVATAPKQPSIAALGDAKERANARKSGAFSQPAVAPDLPSYLPIELPIEPSPSESAQCVRVRAREPARDANAIEVVRAKQHSFGDQFAAFWAAYPRKVSKGRALKAFKAALRKVPIERILDGVRRERWNADIERRPYPATWLNDEGWDNDIHAHGFDAVAQDRKVLEAAGLSEEDLLDGLPL